MFIAVKAAQLHALLQMTFFEARESFESMAAPLRDNFLSACATLASDCEAQALLALGREEGVRARAPHQRRRACTATH